MILFLNIVALGFLAFAGLVGVALLILAAAERRGIFVDYNRGPMKPWVLPGVFLSLAWLLAQFVGQA